MLQYELRGRNILITRKGGAGQQVSLLSGRVTDANGNPLPGVFVMRKGQPPRMMTDPDGTFSIHADPGDTLRFSLPGLANRKYPWRE